MSKIQSIVFLENCSMQGHNTQMTGARDERAAREMLFSVLAGPQFFLHLTYRS